MITDDEVWATVSSGYSSYRNIVIRVRKYVVINRKRWLRSIGRRLVIR
jgi:hypothetical protein